METWIILVIIGVCILAFCIMLSIANFSSDKFADEFKKYEEKNIKENINALDFIHNLNVNIFNGKIKVSQTKNKYENYYLSSKKTIGFSKEVLNSNSISSFAIIAHEMGHAYQDSTGKKLKFLNLLRRFGSFIGFFFMPILIVGIIFLFISSLRYIAIPLLCSAGGIFVLAVIIKTATIALEKDASKKGIEFLKKYLENSEVSDCKKLLNAARLTYWGDLFRLLFSWTLLTRKSKMFR